jgi:hypothetical protein
MPDALLSGVFRQYNLILNTEDDMAKSKSDKLASKFLYYNKQMLRASFVLYGIFSVLYVVFVYDRLEEALKGPWHKWLFHINVGIIISCIALWVIIVGIIGKIIYGSRELELQKRNKQRGL